jgi:murein DD-endopeptidase MepM/ murein hydrolase activator NlpD
LRVWKAARREGQYYYNARWYDPTLGRFITEDPARDGDNWYAYVSNNPLAYIDPTGLLEKIINDMSNAPLGGTITMTSAFGLRPEPEKEIWKETNKTESSTNYGSVTIRTEKSTLKADPVELHGGVDIVSSKGAGTPVLSISEGYVVSSDYSATYGFNVKVQSGDTTFQYSHLYSPRSNLEMRRTAASLPKKGTAVYVGSELGRMGSTGRSTGAHLDLSATVSGARVDPTSFLSPSVLDKMNLGGGVGRSESGAFANQTEKTQTKTLIDYH